MKLKIIILFFIISFTFNIFPQDSNSGEVKLNLNDYIKMIKNLWEKDRLSKDTTSDLPVKYIINSSNLDGRVTGNQVDFQAVVTFQSLQKGWLSIPVIEDKAGIKEAFLDDKDVGFLPESNMLNVIVNEKGTHVLKFSFSLPLENTGFAFNIVQSPITNIKLTMKNNNTNIIFNNSKSSLIVTNNGQIFASAALGLASMVNVSIVRKIEENENAKPVISGDVYTLVSVGEGMMSCYTEIAYLIRDAKISKLEIEIPDDIMISDVAGEGVINFTTKKSNNKKILYVDLNQPAKGNITIAINYEKTLQNTSGSYDVPIILLQNVIRQKGYIGVQDLTNVEVKTDSSEKITMIDIKELPGVIWDKAEMPLLLGYKYLDNGNLKLKLKRYSDESLLTSICEKITYTSVITANGRSLTRAVLTIRNTNDQFMKIQLPPNSTIWSSLLSNNPIKLSKDESSDLLLLPLEKSQMGDTNLKTFMVEIVYITDINKFGILGSIKNNLCKTMFEVQKIEYFLLLPVNYKYFINPGTSLNSGINSDFSNITENEKQIYGGELDTKAPELSKKSNFSNNQLQMDSQSPREEQSLNYFKKGTLPVQIDLPTTGIQYEFSKTLPQNGMQEKISFYFFSPLVWFTLKILVLSLFLAILITLTYFIAGKFRKYAELDKKILMILGIVSIITIVMCFFVEINIFDIFSVILLSILIIALYDIVNNLTKTGILQFELAKYNQWIFISIIIIYILIQIFSYKAGIEENLSNYIIAINILIFFIAIFILFIKFIIGLFRKKTEKPVQ